MLIAPILIHVVLIILSQLTIAAAVDIHNVLNRVNVVLINHKVVTSEATESFIKCYLSCILYVAGDCCRHQIRSTAAVIPRSIALWNYCRQNVSTLFTCWCCLSVAMSIQCIFGYVFCSSVLCFHVYEWHLRSKNLS